MKARDHCQPTRKQVGPGDDRSPPRILSGRSLKKDNFEVREHIQDSEQCLKPCFDLRNSRVTVDVPGVGVPRQNVGRVNACRIHHVRLVFGRGVIILNAEHSRAGSIECARAGIPKHSEEAGGNSAMHWRDVRHPSAALLPELIDESSDWRDVWLVKTCLLFVSKPFITHHSV